VFNSNLCYTLSMFTEDIFCSKITYEKSLVDKSIVSYRSLKSLIIPDESEFSDGKLTWEGMSFSEWDYYQMDFSSKVACIWTKSFYSSEPDISSMAS
jgi:hypothetical protein